MPDRTPDDIKREHEEKFAKMQSDRFGEEEVLDFSPESEQEQLLRSATTQIDVTPMGNVEVISAEQEQLDNQLAEPIAEPPKENWSYSHSTAPQIDGAYTAPKSSPSETVKDRVVKQAAHPPASAPQQPTKPTSQAKLAQDYFSQHYVVTNSADFLRQKYGAQTTSQEQGGFTFTGAKSSAKPSDSAGRPQPPPASGTPSHPFPLLESAPKLPEPDDIDFPDGQQPGQHPQEGKRRQNTTQTSNLAESLDMALEQNLAILDRMAAKLQSVSQRLTVIESIIDRTY